RAHPGENHRGYLALSLGLVVFLLGLAASAWWAAMGPAARFFLYVRAIDVTAGESPLVPMGLFGVTMMVLGFCGLKLADLIQRVQLRCPYPASDAEPFNAIRQADARLRRSLLSPLGFLARTEAAPDRPVANIKSWGIAIALGCGLLAYAFWNMFVISL